LHNHPCSKCRVAFKNCSPGALQVSRRALFCANIACGTCDAVVSVARRAPPVALQAAVMEAPAPQVGGMMGPQQAKRRCHRERFQATLLDSLPFHQCTAVSLQAQQAPHVSSSKAMPASCLTCAPAWHSGAALSQLGIAVHQPTCAEFHTWRARALAAYAALRCSQESRSAPRLRQRIRRCARSGLRGARLSSAPLLPPRRQQPRCALQSSGKCTELA